MWGWPVAGALGWPWDSDAAPAAGVAPDVFATCTSEPALSTADGIQKVVAMLEEFLTGKAAATDNQALLGSRLESATMAHWLSDMQAIGALDNLEVPTRAGKEMERWRR